MSGEAIVLAGLVSMRPVVGCMMERTTSTSWVALLDAACRTTEEKETHTFEVAIPCCPIERCAMDLLFMYICTRMA